jgi:hypothetical protein
LIIDAGLPCHFMHGLAYTLFLDLLWIDIT